MNKLAILALADGTIYEGCSFGADTEACGEVVFNTSMTSYQEVLTDPSYAGQIVVPTYPVIGNCGINEVNAESDRAQIRGLAVREVVGAPSHYQSSQTIEQYLTNAGIPGITGLDTRAITRKLRSQGTMMGILTSQKTPEQALEFLRTAPAYKDINLVREFSARSVAHQQVGNASGKYRVAVLDCGCPRSILRMLSSLDCATTIMPHTASAKEILDLTPDGLFVSPGPGNAELLDDIVRNLQGLVGHFPIIGVGLGSQLITRALGGKNIKLKYGHHGNNHPVRDLRTGRVYITSQNHGYIPDSDSLPSELEISHCNLNDGTIEGLRHKTLPIMTLQYYSESSSRSIDGKYIFEEFLEMIRQEKGHP